MNIIIFKDGSDDIIHFIRECIKKDNNFTGLNFKLCGLNLAKYKYMWTDDEAELIDPDSTIYDKKVSDMTESSDTCEVIIHPRSEKREAEKKKAFLSALTYNQVDHYIDNNVTNLAEAKEYLKKLSSVVLGIIKIIDEEK